MRVPGSKPLMLPACLWDVGGELDMVPTELQMPICIAEGNGDWLLRLVDMAARPERLCEEVVIELSMPILRRAWSACRMMWKC